MPGETLQFVLLALTLSVAFNLFLTLRLVRIVGDSEYKRIPMTLPTGQPLPEFHGRSMNGTRRVDAPDLLGRAWVLLFFAPECDKCKARIAEINQMYPAIRDSGAGLWVVSSLSKKRMAAFLKDSPLLDHVLLVGASEYAKLNPLKAAPFYIFIDDARTVLANNLIGDEHWRSFCQQISGTDATAA